MTNILGYPRRELSEREATIRATLSRIESTGVGVSDGDKGDISVTGSGSAWTVDAAGGVIFVKTPMTGTGLQTLINSLTSGGRIVLGPGTHYADSATPSTPLTYPSTVESVIIEGLGGKRTKIGSPVLIQANKCTLRDVFVDPGATSYCIKLENVATFISHTRLEGVTTNGATNSLIINNTVIETLATNCSFEFSTGAALTFPGSATTTTTFINCAFTQSDAQAVLGVTSSGLTFRDCNFESSSAVCTSFVDLTNCQNVLFDRCNMEITGGTITNGFQLQTCIPARITLCNILGNNLADRAALIQNSPYCVFDSNRISEFNTAASVVIDSACGNGTAHGNAFTDGTEFVRIDTVAADYLLSPDIARVTVRKNTGSDVGSRRRLNLIEGENITLTVSDDSSNEEVDVTVAAAKSIVRLGSATIDMKTAATTTIFTTEAGKVTRITHIVVRDATASLAGGTSYTVTGFLSAFSLASLVTAGTGFVTVSGAAATAPTECSEIAASTAVQLTVTTGSTAAANATIDVFGYTT